MFVSTYLNTTIHDLCVEWKKTAETTWQVAAHLAWSWKKITSLNETMYPTLSSLLNMDLSLRVFTVLMSFFGTLHRCHAVKLTAAHHQQSNQRCNERKRIQNCFHEIEHDCMLFNQCIHESAAYYTRIWMNNNCNWLLKRKNDWK